jgi:hypothetical protein
MVRRRLISGCKSGCGRAWGRSGYSVPWMGRCEAGTACHGWDGAKRVQRAMDGTVRSGYSVPWMGRCEVGTACHGWSGAKWVQRAMGGAVRSGYNVPWMERCEEGTAHPVWCGEKRAGRAISMHRYRSLWYNKLTYRADVEEEPWKEMRCSAS